MKSEKEIRLYVLYPIEMLNIVLHFNKSYFKTEVTKFEEREHLLQFLSLSPFNCAFIFWASK